MCAKAGARLLSVQTVAGGQRAYRIDCGTHANKVRLLDLLATYDAGDPDVRGLGELCAGAHRGDPWQTMAAAQRLVQSHVTHIDEPVETFTHTMRTLELGRGDCDDSARAVCAILRSVGVPARLRTIGTPPRHVYAEGQTEDGRWHPLEATIDAKPGEPPLAAAERLGITGREDL